MDYREVPAFGEEVADQTIRVLVHPTLPGMIRRGKNNVGLEPLGGVPMSGELFTVVVGNGVDMGAQGGEPLHCRPVRGLGCGPGQFRDRREEALALDMRQQRPFVVGAHNRIPLPITQP